jgi:hypothetical protein
MADDILEFCNECGLQLPRGLDVCICSLLELEDSEESQGCFNCGKKYSEHDEWFWDYYSDDFDGAGWFSVEHVSCRDCIMKYFNLDHPDYEDSGLRPDTFLVWKEGLQIGVDLSPRLAELENSNSIRRLSDSWVFREEIVKWLNSDCPVDEAEEWASVVDNFDEAMAWRNAGFGPYEESTGNWLRWKCSPETAAKYVQMGIEYVPGVHYIELGVSLEDAVFFELNDFSDHVDDSGRYFVGVWLASGLSVQEILSLRDHIVENMIEFNAVFERSEARLKYENGNVDLWEALPYQFEQLKTLGLPIEPKNLLMYWGLSSKEILKVIDAGGRPGVAAEVIRGGGSVSKLPIIERLIELGIAQPWANTLARRGLLVKHLKKIEQSKSVQDALYSLAQSLDANADMKIDEAIGWLEVEAMPNEIKLWRQYRFTPQDAAQWANEGFNPESAGRWRAAGADSPITAKRRRDAGLQP